MSAVPEESDSHSFLSTVLIASQSAARLTGQMLAYSGQSSFIFRCVNLSEIVREAGSLVKGSIPEFVTLEFDLSADPLFVDADLGQITQLITSLVINGAEAVPEGEPGCVRVTTRLASVEEEYIRFKVPAQEPGKDLSRGKFVVLEVEDSGSGMDTATQARIFEPFFTTKFTGRGMGLAAALGIVKGHGGSIVVKSEPRGGTTFQVFLPPPAVRG